ncbi:MAG: Holliday junction branch migration protein RuvA [Oscillospiraceae bacterium]|nr:Holliday junction branch migration protein RuvA [Oscillospiraceae bacterium]
MIYSLSGKLILKEPNAIVVECGGVGFRCAVSVFTVQQLPQLGEQVTVFTHLAVREDAMDLFAFGDQEELLCFKRLISVSGVGPKLAQRIVLELKDKVELDGASAADLPGGVVAPSSGGAQGEAISALVALGYTQAEAATAVARLDPTLSVEDMIRGALRQMM